MRLSFKAPAEYSGDVIPAYAIKEPTGSGADVRAKGKWENGYWTVELLRKLNTGYPDDTAFDPARTYAMAVAVQDRTGDMDKSSAMIRLRFEKNNSFWFVNGYPSTQKEIVMKRFQLATAILVLSTSTVFATPTTYTVFWQGTLQAAHGGDASGKVTLQQFAGKQNLYAVGPVAELGGEITVIAGKFYIARVKHGEVKTDSNLSTSASFLVWSEVTSWKPPVSLGAKAGNLAQLEKQIEVLATKAGVDTSKPFPFKLEGVLDSVDYHVLVPKTHQQAQAGHSDGTKKISGKNSDAEIIGFFSKNHEGVFTHKGSFIHLHVIERHNGYSGHVDEISAGPGVQVLLPQ